VDNGGVDARIIKLSRARMYFSFLANFFTPPSDLCTRDTSSAVHLLEIYIVGRFRTTNRACKIYTI
jgi:hypothetical protein